MNYTWCWDEMVEHALMEDLLPEHPPILIDTKKRYPIVLSDEEEEEDDVVNDYTDKELMQRIGDMRWCRVCGHDMFSGARCHCMQPDAVYMLPQLHFYCERCGFLEDGSCVCERFPMTTPPTTWSAEAPS